MSVCQCLCDKEEEEEREIADTNTPLYLSVHIGKHHQTAFNAVFTPTPKT